MIRALAAVGGVAALAAAVNVAIGGYVARRVIAPRTEKKSIAVGVTGDTVTVPVSEETTQPGTYGIWLRSGAHVAVGEVLRVREHDVVRAVLSDTRAPRDDSDTGVWSSQYLASPHDVGPTTTVPIELADGGTAQAWEIAPADGDDGRWAIHIHGLRSSRLGALRSTPPTVAAGWRSLVVSYAGDDERIPSDGLPSSLGTREWADVESAMHYAVSQGAREIILVAWSMGATIALLALEHSSVADRVVGLVLVAPALEWSRVITNATRGAHLPPTVAAAAVGVLRSPLGSRVLRLREPVDAAALNWVDGHRGAVAIPTLILHSRHDPVVPFSGSADFAATHPEVELVEFSTTGHCNEPNQNPELFTGSIDAWLAEFHRQTP